ncbi:methyl-accepting chemotaxis protein [Rhodocista pekingensis]|uniref:Methyl-accepting chemotaxis protein n=1 Tax=Rhodocista pekingensis TaxID=201185 RepID=A0ABW2KW66_9PROT
MQPASPQFWRRVTVGGKLMLITVLFAVSIAVLLAGTVSALRTQETMAAHSDAMGRQRFLVARYYIDVMQTAQGVPADFQSVKRIFDANVASMLTGGSVVTDLDGYRQVLLPAAPTAEIERLLREQLEAMARLEAGLNRFLALPPEARADPAVIEEMVQLRKGVTARADEATRLFVRNAQEESQAMLGMMVALGIIAVLLGAAGVLLISRSIVQPLQDCVRLARAIADGDLRQQPLPVRSGDEVGRLMAAFNDMLEGLRAITAETRGTAGHLATSVQEILASIQQQASSTREQAAAVQEITTTVEEIGQSAQQVAEMAREVGGNADSIAGTGQHGLQAVQEAAAAMEAIRSQTESVAETIVALSERTQAIGEIISTVNEISEQSNLVALNAAIEAAGAGEQGRRFAVVANEIKALADQAKEATRQVRGILEQTQRNISTSVLLTEEALKRAGVGRDKALAAETVIRQMAGGVQETSGSFQQVVGATGQQQIGLEQIAQGLQQIRQASVQAASGTDQLAKAAESLSQLGGTLTRLMEKYRL